MKRFAAGVLLLVILQVGQAQVAPECSGGCFGPTGEQWSMSQESCVSGPGMSCGFGCSCVYGYFLQTTLENGKATSKLLVFGGGNTPEGFRLDLIGPFGRNRIAKGDRVYRLNGRKPTRALILRYTEKRPARRAQATYDEQGRLHLTIWR